MAVIDATNLILGRMAAVIAKRALQGETIIIVNCEKTVISGNKAEIFEQYRHNRDRGGPFKGPYFPRRADAIIRRTIRGMIPYKQAKGERAYKNITCHIGVPETLANGKFETIEVASIQRLNTPKYVVLGDITKYIGGQ
jgi:large subunit ribosomal protein L13